MPEEEQKQEVVEEQVSEEKVEEVKPEAAEQADEYAEAPPVDQKEDAPGSFPGQRG